MENAPGTWKKNRETNHHDHACQSVPAQAGEDGDGADRILPDPVAR
jgi:hypothetical protein